MTAKQRQIQELRQRFDAIAEAARAARAFRGADVENGTLCDEVDEIDRHVQEVIAIINTLRSA